MDLVGLLMGWATIPMALITMVSVGAGFYLLLAGAWGSLVAGGIAFLGCSAVAPVLERLVIGIDDMAARSIDKNERDTARVVAVASGGLPVAVVLAWETLVFVWFHEQSRDASPLALWLWSYGIATGPWTLFALYVSRFRRTLCGIRAYAGHIAFWLLSILALGMGTAPADAWPIMMLPAILPFVVGMLLALSDRDAITNVRV